jgi:SOS response regulatory protein OraA/RecX
LQRDFERYLCLEWIDKFNQHNLQRNERFAESLIRGCTNKGIGESRIRNELKEHQISAEIVASAMSELRIEWFELAVNVYEKNMRESQLKILKNNRSSKDFYIIVVLPMNKVVMRLNRQKINTFSANASLNKGRLN